MYIKFSVMNKIFFETSNSVSTILIATKAVLKVSVLTICG